MVFHGLPPVELTDVLVDLARAVRRARIETLLADADFDGERVDLIVPSHGVRTIIPPSVRWLRMMKQRFSRLRRKYGRRWQVETVDSMLKRSLGSAPCARNYEAQNRELVLKAIAYNCMIVRLRVFYRAVSWPWGPLRLLGDGLRGLPFMGYVCESKRRSQPVSTCMESWTTAMPRQTDPPKHQANRYIKMLASIITRIFTSYWLSGLFYSAISIVAISAKTIISKSHFRDWVNDFVEFARAFIIVWSIFGLAILILKYTNFFDRKGPKPPVSCDSVDTPTSELG